MNRQLTSEKVIVPMVSPFKTDHSVDEEAVVRICGMFREAGVSVFVLGTTGEGDSMSAVQRATLVKQVVREVKGELKIFAGLTGNSLSESVEDGKRYADLGAEYLVAKLPNYYPIDGEQMLRYFGLLADSVTLPLYIYNIPSTTHNSIPTAILDKLSHHPNILGVKDSERDPTRLEESLRLWGRREDFELLIGWAAKSAYGLENGASGIVPSTGNLTPALYAQMIESVKIGNMKTAQELQEKTNKISALYQKERNLSQSITALKTLMQMKGLCSGEVLPPMHTLSPQEREDFISKVSIEFNQLNI